MFLKLVSCHLKEKKKGLKEQDTRGLASKRSSKQGHEPKTDFTNPMDAILPLFVINTYVMR